ncbi:MAG: hypothetical protein IPM74_13340 [Crocinitomicaceae bacterium]|nr:hypothetical protein [Crocinitomicaceae bacterium]MBK8926857.1 hypothetical protein [Crocinitomicaceae bacterium]
MANKKNRERRDPAYQREQGKREAYKKPERKITFSMSLHIKGEGETEKEWETLGLLSQLYIRMKQCGQLSIHQIKQNKWIKEYHKVTFPPKSGFKEPKHVTGVTWAVMHITNNSKEVVVGFVENDIFYIVFFDKEHKFWPTEKKST